VNDLTREVGGAFGIAVLGSILNNGYRDEIGPVAAHLPPPAASAARSSVAGAAEVAARAGAHGPALLERAQSAFVSGFSTALLVGHACCSPRASWSRSSRPRAPRSPPDAGDARNVV